MNRIKHIVSIMLLILVVVSCKNDAKPEIKTLHTESKTKKELDPNATYAKAEFTIEGMTCAVGCAATIQKKISNMDGVKYAKVDFDNKLALVEYDEATVTPNALEQTVTKVANIYKVSNMKTVNAFSIKKN